MSIYMISKELLLINDEKPITLTVSGNVEGLQKMLMMKVGLTGEFLDD